MTYARYSTYGELYTAMATTTGEIPIAIYRTEENVDSTTASQNVSTGYELPIGTCEVYYLFIIK